MTTFLTAPWSSPQRVSSRLITPPSAEPITLDEAKLAAGLDWPSGDPRDQQMTDWIRAAREQVERDTGLALLTQTRHVTITVVPGGVVPLPAQAVPLQSITALEVAPVATVVGWGVSFPPEAAPLTTTYEIVSGWPDPATLATEAPLLVHAVSVLTAHYATFGRDLALPDMRVTMTPHGYNEAVDSYRLVWLT